jgi:hypothetical protein
MVLTIIAQAQDTNIKTYMENTDQNWPSISGPLIAYHDLPKELDPWENLDIYEILDFIDESIENRSLVGYGSGPLAENRLGTLKDRIEAVGYILENGTFEEACRQLLEAYLSSDGLSQPPDLVYGQAAPELAKKIKYLRIEIIGCK